MAKKQTPQIAFSCPSELLEEVDRLCRINYMERTDFIVLATLNLARLVEANSEVYLEQLKTELPTLGGYEDEEATLQAAEEEDSPEDISIY